MNTEGSKFDKPKRKKKRNHVQKKRTSERRKLEVECRGLTAELIKQRDHDTCQRCGRSAQQGYKIDAAHILPKGAYPLMQFVLENIVALCFACHDWWHKQSEGLAWVESKWPGRVERLRISARMARKVDLKELLIVLQSEVQGRTYGSSSGGKSLLPSSPEMGAEGQR